MYFRTILSGTLAVLLASSLAASAGNGSRPDDGGFLHLPKFNLPGVFGGGTAENNIRTAQQADPAGVTGIEDQLRQMNGRIEELNFQVLQMQEQIRKQQEDNEFRFQQLEQGGGGGQGGGQKKSDAAGETNRSLAKAPASGASGDVAPSSADDGQTVEEVIIDSGNGEPGQVLKGAPPKTFGTITVDKNGNVIDAGGTQATPPAKSSNSAKSGNSEGTVVAALPSTDDPEELYRNSYQFILSGDYGTAEQGFRDHIARFPKDAKAADAHYWLGEALLGQQKYRDAAEVFLAASKDYPKSKKAPDMLLKLGISLAGLNQRDVACATFNEVTKRYPDVSSALKARVKQEKANASC
jgi:tol-pal system protein YbgF